LRTYPDFKGEIHVIKNKIFVGPEDICGTYDLAEEGDAIPILGRDSNSDWKLAELNGTPSYILLGNAYLNEKLANYESLDWRAEDLEIFPQPDPCPPAVSESRQKTCSDYTNEAPCEAAG